MLASLRGASEAGARRPPRAYEAHEGHVWFCLGGRLQTSRDSPWIVLVSIGLMIALPTLWLVWQASFLWRHVSPALLILGAYFWGNAVAAMV